jgi:SAM-dependent methyltransferase
VDAVFAAEAFHWFVDARALAEIARVLRPRGALVLMWNLPAGPWEPSIANVEQLLHERGPKPGEVSYDRLPLLDEVRSLLAAAQYRRLWETHVHWTRLAAGPPERRS